MFVDTSVVVAILSAEEDALHWAEKLEQAPQRVTSALVILEAVMRLSTKLAIGPMEVEVAVNAFLHEAEIDVAAIDAADGRAAVDAFTRYGKGRGHPAQLNLADCLSYACARNRGMQLLYKGDGFAHTDMA
jgi:ribonuclease VapC